MKLIANGIVQSYRRLGAGPPIIFIHALGLSHRLWEPQVAQLASAYTVIVYDVRGHGQTEVTPGPYSLGEFAEDLAGTMEALGLDSAHLVGISLGGMIAQEFALSFPQRVRSLVLADTASEFRQAQRRQLAELARVAEERGLAPLIESILDGWFAPAFRQRQPAEVERAAGMLAQMDPFGCAASCRAIAQIDVTERLVNVTVPTAVLVGEIDPVTPPEAALKIHEHIPGSAYQIIPGAGHLTSLEAPEVFNQIVIETVEKVESPAAGGA